MRACALSFNSTYLTTSRRLLVLKRLRSSAARMSERIFASCSLPKYCKIKPAEGRSFGYLACSCICMWVVGGGRWRAGLQSPVSSLQSVIRAARCGGERRF